MRTEKKKDRKWKGKIEKKEEKKGNGKNQHGAEQTNVSVPATENSSLYRLNANVSASKLNRGIRNFEYSKTSL